jgi:gluconate 2-dehydrogenase gamma chain
MKQKPDDHSPSRRTLLKSLTFIPVAAASASGAVADAADSAAAGAAPATSYTPSFFNKAEWEFIFAACDRLIPHDDEGPGAVELGVPEFLDRHMQTPYASGGIWYMQGPFLEASDKFGYQGRLALRDILRLGINAVDQHCRDAQGGKSFVGLSHAEQETVLKSVEKGELKIEGLSSKMFFTMFLAEVRNGYFSDPKHGGNKGMGAWKMIGYPGMRADYTDWVEVRDKPYPLPPVDLAGRRG